MSNKDYSIFTNRLFNGVFWLGITVQLLPIVIIINMGLYPLVVLFGFALCVNLYFYINRAKHYLVDLSKKDGKWKLVYYSYNTLMEKEIDDKDLHISFRMAAGRGRLYKFEIKEGSRLVMAQYQRVGDWSKDKLNTLFENIKNVLPSEQVSNRLIVKNIFSKK